MYTASTTSIQGLFLTCSPNDTLSSRNFTKSFCSLGARLSSFPFDSLYSAKSTTRCLDCSSSLLFYPRTTGFKIISDLLENVNITNILSKLHLVNHPGASHIQLSLPSPSRAYALSQTRLYFIRFIVDCRLGSGKDAPRWSRGRKTVHIQLPAHIPPGPRSADERSPGKNVTLRRVSKAADIA